MAKRKLSRTSSAFLRGAGLALLLAIIVILMPGSVYRGLGLPPYPTLFTAVFAGFVIGALSGGRKLVTSVPEMLLITCTAIALPVAGATLVPSYVGPYLYPDPSRPTVSHDAATLHERIDTLHERIEATTRYRAEVKAVGEKRNALAVPGLVAGFSLTALFLLGLFLFQRKTKVEDNANGEVRQNHSASPNEDNGKDLP